MHVFHRLWRTASATCLLASLTAAHPAEPESQPYVWRNAKIGGGGFVTGIVFHPVQRNLVYARTDVGGAYRWDPANGSWIPLNDMLGKDQASLYGVLSLAVDPRNPDLVYLACGEYTKAWERNNGAILWSANRGASWSRAILTFKLGGNEDGRSTGERLQVDPNDGGVLFLGTSHDGLWTSTGHHVGIWDQVVSFPATSVTFVLFESKSGKPGVPTPTLYVGTAGQDQNLWRSTDGGTTWTNVPGQPRNLIPHHAQLDAAGTLSLSYANHLGPNGATDGAVWKFDSTNGAWTNISPLTPSAGDTFGYAGLTLDPRHPGTILVTTLDRWKKGDEIFRSVDNGATWSGLRSQAVWDYSATPYVAQFKPHWLGDIKIDPLDSDRAIFVTGYGVWSCGNLTAADSGQATHWVFGDAGLEEAVPAELVSPPVGASLLSAIPDIDGFRHDDLNISPPQGRFQPSHSSSLSIAFAESKPTMVVRTHISATTGGSYSLDGGISWTQFPSSPPTAISNGPGAIAISADGSRLVWLPRGSAPFYSVDLGATWSECRGGPLATRDHRTVRPIADRVNPAKFYIYDFVGGKIFASLDGGATFSIASRVPVDGGTLRADPDREGHLLLPSSAGLFRSIDSGTSFAEIGSVQEADQVGYGKAAPDQDRPAIFLTGTVREVQGIFRSDDSGQTWKRINDGEHRFGWITGITGDPRIYGRVYLATSGRGIIFGDPSP